MSPTNTSGRDRWGDYASVAVDPDGCTLWFATEYLDDHGTDDVGHASLQCEVFGLQLTGSDRGQTRVRPGQTGLTLV